VEVEGGGGASGGELIEEGSVDECRCSWDEMEDQIDLLCTPRLKRVSRIDVEGGMVKKEANEMEKAETSGKGPTLNTLA